MDADLVVIGGGIIGLSTARLFQLRHPDARVTVLEQALIGTGASNFGGAADVEYAWSDVHRELILRNRKVRAAHPAAFDTSQEVRTIWIGSAPSPECLGARVMGTRMNALTAKEVDALPIRLRANEYAFEAETGRVGSPALACRKLASELRLSGANIHEGTRVSAVSPVVGGVRVSCVDGHSTVAARVVISTGPWSATQSLGDGDIAPGGRTKKIIAFHIETGGRLDGLQIQYDTEDLYLIPDPVQPGRTILSLCSDDWDVLPGDSLLCLSAADHHQARTTLSDIAPDLLPELRGGRVFCDAYSPNGAPIVQANQEIPGLFKVGYGSGSGFFLAPGLAHLAVQHIEET